MNTLPSSPLRRCDGVSRRDFLHLGVLASFGWSVRDLLGLQAAAGVIPATRSAATSCILIWLDGGPSHLDMFDLKPDAPSEVRSQFKAIPTDVAGLHICRTLPPVKSKKTRCQSGFSLRF